MDVACCWSTIPPWSTKPNLLPSAICWNIWLEQYARSFKDKESNREVIKNNIRPSLLSWSSMFEGCRDLRFQEVVFDWDIILFSPSLCSHSPFRVNLLAQLVLAILMNLIFSIQI